MKYNLYSYNGGGNVVMTDMDGRKLAIESDRAEADWHF